MTLDRLSIGTQAIITAVGGERTLRCRLLDMGLIPGTKVSIHKVAPMGDPLELNIRGYSLTLRKEDAHNIEVEVQ
ncbi:MAG: ferrous iron transport protein A [Oscillospiraceae bacterium]|nr:ferrous iron transport protein A [Oscillospiraceae bacterium]